LKAIFIRHFSVTFNRDGGASAVKESGHFEVRKSSNQVTQMYFYPRKSCRPFFFNFVFTLLPKQSNMQGGAWAWARAVDLPARSFDLARPDIAPSLAVWYFLQVSVA